MKRWKQGLAALGLAVLLAGGSWAGLIVGWRSARTMGKAAGQLPRVVFQADGGIKMTYGQRQHRLEAAQVKSFFEKAAKAELLIPRSLRIAGLAALTGAFWAEQEEQPAAGQKLLTGDFCPTQEEHF